MELKHNPNLSADKHLAVLLDHAQDIKKFCSEEKEIAYVNRQIKEKTGWILLNQWERYIFFLLPQTNHKEAYQIQEEFRRQGFELYQILEKEKITEIQFQGTKPKDLLAILEGFLLSTYKFQKYLSQTKVHPLKQIDALAEGLNQEMLDQLKYLIEANFICRDLVNEPVNYLSAEKLAEETQKLAKEVNLEVEVFRQAKIKSLHMHGLLAVNQGSVAPPTFISIHHRPTNAINERPYILVGKGVVYDTGGLSLKPTAKAMDFMKCDMAGGGAVIATLYALAKNQIPLYVIGLVPATDNRPGKNAMAPGDVIKMMNGKSVEIMNTDAEGRLILADALCYASKYNPQLVIDLATLTGSAAHAIGKEAMVMMGTAPTETKQALIQSGQEVYERLVEFPLWEEYGEQLKSAIADIKNLGGNTAGAITAGKFLEHFTNYPWIHLDIAGTAFLHESDTYRGKQGTGSGVRLIYHFLAKLANGLF